MTMTTADIEAVLRHIQDRQHQRGAFSTTITWMLARTGSAAYDEQRLRGWWRVHSTTRHPTMWTDQWLPTPIRTALTIPHRIHALHQRLTDTIQGARDGWHGHHDRC